MPDEISLQILSQTSDNIQRLFELSTRIDERVKLLQEKHNESDDRLERLVNVTSDFGRKIAVLEAHDRVTGPKEMSTQFIETKKEVASLDKRVSALEVVSGGSEDRWKQISTFVIQLVWIILAAWLLMKLNINPPPVP